MSYWYALVVFYLSFHCSLWKMFAFSLRWSLQLSKAISTMFFGIIAVFPSKLHLAAMHYNENASNSDMPFSIQNTSGGTEETSNLQWVIFYTNGHDKWHVNEKKMTQLCFLTTHSRLCWYPLASAVWRCCGNATTLSGAVGEGASSWITLRTIQETWQKDTSHTRHQSRFRFPSESYTRNVNFYFVCVASSSH